MANTRMTAVITSVTEAEKIINNNAYGDELDSAIDFLKENDPQNAVLRDAIANEADIDREGYKAMAALRRVKAAEESQNYEELENIALFLNMTSKSVFRRQAKKILMELPEVKDNPEVISLAGNVFDAADDAQKAAAAVQAAQDAAPSMSDDEIMQNVAAIDSITTQEFEDKIYAEAIAKAKKNVTIVDAEGKPIDEEKSENMWIRLAKQKVAEAAMMSMDDAGFAAQNEKEKKDTLYDRATSTLWADLGSMSGIRVINLDGNEDKNAKDMNNAEDRFFSGRPTTIKADAFDASYVAAKGKMADKAGRLDAKNKTKAGSWLKDKLQKFNNWSEQKFGMTAVEFGQDLLGYFSRARGITNTVAAVGMAGAAIYSIPAGLAAAAVYGAYQAVAPTKWTILEKKQANYRAAKKSGNTREMAIWKGVAGVKHAYNAIQANAKEKARYDRTKRINKLAGWGSAAVVAIACPLIMYGGLATVGLGIGAATAYLGARVLSGGVRMAGANTNAWYQMQEARRQYLEDQTPENKKGYNKAKAYFGLGCLSTALAEFAMAYNALDSFRSDYALGVEKNPENVANANEAQPENSVENQPAKPVEKVVAIEKPKAPTEWNENMKINSDQFDTAKLHDSKFEKYFNAQNALAEDKNNEAFVNVDGSKMTTEEVWYKADRIMSLAKVRPDGDGGFIARMFDENHKEVFLSKDRTHFEYADGTTAASKDIAPECWGSEERVAIFRAIYKEVDCGNKVGGIDAAEFNKLYDDAVHGTGGAYMDVDKCQEVHFIGKVKSFINRVVHGEPEAPKEVKETVVAPKEPTETKISGDVKITDKEHEDVYVSDASVTTKHNVGTTSSGESGQLVTDEVSLKYNKDLGVGIVPDSRVIIYNAASKVR